MTVINRTHSSTRAAGLLCALMMLLASAASAQAAQRYGLIIANKDYRHSAPVAFADRDAAAFKSALVNAFNVPETNIEVIDNAALSDMNYIFGDASGEGRLKNYVGGPDSELFVYFAGHGSKEAGPDGKSAEPYLLGVDARPQDLKGTAYPLGRLISRLKTFASTHIDGGRVMLVLESCFSGRSDAGELIEGVSAPALGPPVELKATAEAATRDDAGLVIMAAAQGDQFAIWDDKHEQSVFTDALVAGLYGEADQKEFGGDGDKKVTIGEVRRFVSRRVATRLRTLRPGSTQQPEILGGKSDAVLVDRDKLLSPWPQLVERRHRETLRSGQLLARRDASEIQRYLGDCTYCPRADTLRELLRQERRKATICAIEKENVDRLLQNGSVAEIAQHKKDCQCCQRVAALDARIATLQAEAKAQEQAADAGQDPSNGNARPVASWHRAQGDDADKREGDAAQADAGRTVRTAAVTSQAAGTPEAGEQSEPAPELDRYELVRRIQTVLKDKRCYTSRVDGIWGSGSRRAVSRFNEAADADLDAEPSMQVLETVETVGVECPLVCGSGYYKSNGRCIRKQRARKTYEAPKTRKKTYTPKRTNTRKKTYSRKKRTTTRKKPTRTCFESCIDKGGSFSQCTSKC